jgi:hypothetical protein
VTLNPKVQGSTPCASTNMLCLKVAAGLLASPGGRFREHLVRTLTVAAPQSDRQRPSRTGV